MPALGAPGIPTGVVFYGDAPAGGGLNGSIAEISQADAFLVYIEQLASALFAGGGGQGTQQDVSGVSSVDLPADVVALLEMDGFIENLRLAQLSAARQIDQIERYYAGISGGSKHLYGVPIGVIIRKGRIWGFDISEQGTHVVRGKQEDLPFFAELLGGANVGGATEPISNALAVVIVFPLQRTKPDFDGIKAIFEQLEEVTPVFITHGGRTYVVVGPAGPFGISVDDL